MTPNDNTVRVVRRALRHLSINVAYNALEEGLLSHPEYPSLKSITDFLDQQRIDHVAVRLTVPELENLKMSFIAHLSNDSGQLVFVRELTRGNLVRYYDSEDKDRITTKEAFFNSYGGICIVIDGSTVQHKRIPASNNELIKNLLYLLPFVALTFMLMHAHDARAHSVKFDIFVVLSVVLCVVGVVLSVAILLRKTKYSFLAGKCNLPNPNSCNAVLDSKGARVFGWIELADVSVIYFITNTIILLARPNSVAYAGIFLVSVAATPFIFYSIFHQAFILRIWCRLCLSILSLLSIIPFLLYQTIGQLDFSFAFFADYMGVLSVVTLSHLLIRLNRLTEGGLQTIRLSFLRFRRDAGLFQYLLRRGQALDLEQRDGLFCYGDASSALEVIAFLDLECMSCRTSFEQLHDISFRAQFRVTLIFSVRDHNRQVLSHLSRLFGEGKGDVALTFLRSWYAAPREAWRTISPEETPNNLEAILDAHRKAFQVSKITTTPAIFVNAHKLPKEYQIKDLAYFIDHLSKVATN